MSEITRRQLLTFLVATAAVATAGPPLERLLAGGSIAEAAWPGNFTPVRMPHPLPIYTQRSSYLATGIDQGLSLPATADPALSDYTVIDDLVVPPEFERYVIVRWGERIFPDANHYVGYNSDFTAFFPGKNGEGLLWVNHEYVSFPFSFLAPATPSNLTGAATTFQTVIGEPTNLPRPATVAIRRKR